MIKFNFYIKNIFLFSLIFFHLRQPIAFSQNIATTPSATPSSEICGPICNAISPRGLEYVFKGMSKDQISQYCSSHGVPLASIPSASPPPSLAVTPSLSDSSPSLISGCDVPKNPEEACDLATNRITVCELLNSQHQSQLENYCMAYQLTQTGQTGSNVLLGLDGAATALCTVACFMGKANPTLALACDAASLVDGAADAFYTGLLLSQGKMDSTLGSVELVADLLGISVSGYGIVKDVTQLKAKSNDSDNTSPTTTDPDNNNTGGKNKSGIKIKPSRISKTACASAAIFAIMTGLRGADLAFGDQTQQSACHSIQTLLSQNPTPHFSTTFGNNGSGFSIPNGGNNGTLSTASGGALLNGGASSASPPGDYTLSPGSSAALDSGMLTQSGLNHLAPPLAQQLGNNGYLGSARSAVGAALKSVGHSGSIPGGLGDALAHLADQAQKNPKSFAQLLPSQAFSDTTRRNSGGSLKSTSGENTNPFASLFKTHESQNSTGKQSPVVEFNASRTGDIWHTGTLLNLFEIVSERITHLNQN